MRGCAIGKPPVGDAPPIAGWNFGLFQHVAGGAAKDRLAKTRMAVGPHHQHVGVQIAAGPVQHV